MNKRNKIFVYIFLVLLFCIAGISIYLFCITEIVFGIVCLVPLIAFFILAYVFFAKFTNQYPLNSLSDYKFDPKASQLGYLGDANFEIVLIEKNKDIWEIKTEAEHLIFDMRGYFFPKAYICSFFIRNLHYYVINKNKYKLKKLFGSLNLNPLKKYQNLRLVFCNQKRKKSIVIVKGNKTKVTFLRGMLIQSRYHIDTITSGHGNLRLRQHETLNEEKYINEISSRKQKYSLKD